MEEWVNKRGITVLLDGMEGSMFVCAGGAIFEGDMDM